MPADKVDVLFVIDASDSMTPCFNKLRDNIRSFVTPLQQASFSIRYGLLAYCCGRSGNSNVFNHTTLDGEDVLSRLYNKQNVDSDFFFTSDLNRFLTSLANIQTMGDENTPLALDIAADFPFAPVDETRRVIALFSDEKLETGIWGNELPFKDDKFKSVVKKLMTRKISVYSFFPYSEQVSQSQFERLPRSFYTSVDEGVKWENMDFSRLLEGMGKSISASSLQTSKENPYEISIYGAKDWGVCNDAVDYIEGLYNH